MDVIPTVAKEIVARYHRKVVAATTELPEGQGGSRTAAVRSARTDGDGPDAEHAAESGGGATDRGIEAAVTVEFSALLTRLWLLGSDKEDAAGNVGESAQNIERAVEEMVTFLVEQCSVPGMLTLSLQSQSYALKATLRNKRNTAEVKRDAISLRLIDAILKKKDVTADEMLGDMTLYILHRYGQLNSTSSSTLPVHKETAAVLCATLPRPQVISFMRQDTVEKQRQLDELRRIVWGIRIFNKEEGKSSGAGIDLVHPLVEQPLAELELRVNEELVRLQEKLRYMLTLLLCPTCPLRAKERTWLQHEYHHLLQVEHCLLTVRCMHRALAARLHTHVLPQYDAAMAQLRQHFYDPHVTPATTTTTDDVPAAVSGQTTRQAKDDVTAATATGREGPVPRRVVYPLFMELADVYELTVRCVEELEDMRSLLLLSLGSEQSYTSMLPLSMAEEAMQSRVMPSPIADRAALAASLTASLASLPPSTLQGYNAYYTLELPPTMDPLITECYPRSLCGLRGFCPVHYHDHRLLVPGLVNLHDPACPGFIVVEGGSGRWALPKPIYLAFADLAALRRFATDPLAFLLPCLQRCNRDEPGVTILMGLLDRLPRELYIEGARCVEAIESGVASKAAIADGDSGAEVGTQTGQIDSYFDRNYRWNEWDLRRQALKLANLMDMRTHSTQTARSHFRRDMATQASPPKTATTQTMRDVAVQPGRVVQYLKGLRGTTTSRIEQVQEVFYD